MPLLLLERATERMRAGRVGSTFSPPLDTIPSGERSPRAFGVSLAWMDRARSWEDKTMIRMSIFGVSVTVEAAVLVPVVGLWGGVTWTGIRRHPDRRFGRGALMGLATVMVLMPADLGHAFAHIASARLAGAPMDEIRIAVGMPRTLYRDNAVSPAAHRLRAIGGPIFNALGLLLSVAIYGGVRRDSITRELAAWSALGHSWILSMSLSPVPVVDGGTLLKWTLVARGRSEADADATVRRVARGLGLLAGIVGVGLIALQRRRLLGGLRSKWSAPTVLCASLQLP